MPDSFFASSKPRKRKRSTPDASASSHKLKHARTSFSGGKGKHNGRTAAIGNKGLPPKKRRADEELDSDATPEDGLGGIDEMDLRVSDADPGESEDENEHETPAEKRLRLAKLYLDSVKEGLADGEFDAAEIDRELISARLKKDVLEHAGKLHIFIADSLDLAHPPTSTLRTRGHRLPVTCAVSSEDATTLFTSSKDGSIIKWDLHTGKQLSLFRKTMLKKLKNGKGKGKEKEKVAVDGHTDEVWALALSSDGKYLASGGKDRKVGVWDAEKAEWIMGFGGHKDAISALAFRKGTHQLYTASLDRTLRLFDLSPSVMGYVETLFGHQDCITGMDALRSETAVSAGGRDRTVRFWKIVEESQLVFRGGGRSKVRDVLEGGGLDGLDADAAERGEEVEGRGRKEMKFVEGSIDCVAMIDETTFVSGGDSGSICLWSTQKKKPLFTQGVAHGMSEVHSETEGLISTPRWITAIACLRYSDLVASGSWEGDIRIWKVDLKLKSLVLVGTIPAPGYVNSLQLLSPPDKALDGVSWAEGNIVAEADLINGHPGAKGNPTVLMVAGISQEPRLGRWRRVKGEGVVNGALVIALHTRTSSN